MKPRLQGVRSVSLITMSHAKPAGTLVGFTSQTSFTPTDHNNSSDLYGLELDLTSPTVTSIVDDRMGNQVFVGIPVTYTVTFSEDINSNTVSAADFSNAGTEIIALDFLGLTV